MRIDLQSCPLKSCRYQNDGNCTNAKRYEDCILRDMVEIPQNATNGDMIKAMFPNLQVVDVGIHRIVVIFGDCHNMMYRNSYDEDWWNAPYKADKESE